MAHRRRFTERFQEAAVRLPLTGEVPGVGQSRHLKDAGIRTRRCMAFEAPQKTARAVGRIIDKVRDPVRRHFASDFASRSHSERTSSTCPNASPQHRGDAISASCPIMDRSRKP